MALDYDEFIALVEGEGAVSRDEAERAVQATLRTLAERLSGGEVADIARQLPEQARRWLTDGDKAEAFDLDEFLRRVADREGVPESQAEDHARLVFAALGRTITPDELADMASELPKSFAELVDAARRQPVPEARDFEGISAVAFANRVARYAKLSRPEAVRATRAVLETLGERISGGQVRDLAALLPRDLTEPLEVGNSRSHDAARPLSLDEFVLRVAQREGVTFDEAREHARAVFASLREAIPDKEFRDTAAQLPKDYAVLMARP
jgi:uncharacterized protein (DUF2267 family)